MRNFRVIDIYVKNCCLRLVTNRTGSMVFHSDLDPDGAENHNNFSSWIHLSLRLRAVSLLLENPLGKSNQARVTRERKAVARLPPRALLAASPLARDSCSATFPGGFSSKKERLLTVFLSRSDKWR